MTCATCIRFAMRPGSQVYGFCRWPGVGQRPYWHLERPEAVLMIPKTHADCPAERTRKPR